MLQKNYMQVDYKGEKERKKYYIKGWYKDFSAVLTTQAWKTSTQLRNFLRSAYVTLFKPQTKLHTWVISNITQISWLSDRRQVCGIHCQNAALHQGIHYLHYHSW